MNDLKEITAYTLAKLKDSGADIGQCAVTTKVTHEFNVNGGRFTLFRTLFDNSLSVIAFVGGKRGVYSVNKFDTDSINEAVRSAIDTASSSHPDDSWVICSEGGGVFHDGEENPDTDLLFSRTEEFISDVKKEYPLILIEEMTVSHVKIHKVYANSYGTEYDSYAGEYDVSLVYSAHDVNKSSSFFGVDFCVDKLDKPFIECADVRRGLSDMEKQLDTFSCGGKFVGDIILTPSCLGEFLTFVCGNFASDSVILDSTSIWNDKLHKRVASDKLTVSVSPLDPRIICGERVTDEGYVSQNYDFIKNGILESFMISHYVANKTGKPYALNNSYSFIIEPGDVSVDKIIENTKFGVIVGRFSGGSPSSNGDFSGVAKNSFLVENGKITKALSETMISGNLERLFNNIIAISEETVCDGSSVLPTIAFSGVNITGK